MIEIVLSPADLGRVRFVHSPVRELVASLRTLQDPHRRLVYAPWLRQLPDLSSVDLRLLSALSPLSAHSWSFLAPELGSESVELADELRLIAATEPARVRREIDRYAADGPPAQLRALYDDPRRELARVVDELAEYWRLAVEPVWDRVRALVSDDVFYRMDLFAHRGLSGVLESLHPQLSFAGDRLLVDKPHHCVRRNDLTGDGLVLVPCLFTWPALLVACCGDEPASLIYPVRRVGELMDERVVGGEDEPLAALVGRSRAAILRALAEPRSTLSLARQLELTPAAVSQHLKVLKASGLAVARRRGRTVLYHRTAAAVTLLAGAAGHAGATRLPRGSSISG
jgi:DNA-binding transcriptional ArsR family regulator